MQLSIRIDGNGGFKLPLANNEIVQGLIYHSLRSDEGYSLKLHNVGNAIENKTFKLFNFSS